MKEGEKYEINQRITAYLLTFSILLSIGSSVVAAAVAPVEQDIQRMKTRHRKC